jgi:hypothetical protein
VEKMFLQINEAIEHVEKALSVLETIPDVDAREFLSNGLHSDLHRLQNESVLEEIDSITAAE